MDVEHVARVGLAARWLPRQERDLAVGRGVPGKVVDDDEGVLAAVPEVFRHGDPGDGAIHCSPGEAEALATTKMQRPGAPWVVTALMTRFTVEDFWPTADVDADDVAVLLVDHAVDGDRGLAAGAFADDEFALAASEREHCVDHEDAGLFSNESRHSHASNSGRAAAAAAPGAPDPPVAWSATPRPRGRRDGPALRGSAATADPTRPRVRPLRPAYGSGWKGRIAASLPRLRVTHALPRPDVTT